MEITFSLVLLISGLILGICLLFSGILQLTKKDCAPTIEYRFVPRTFDEQQTEPIDVTKLYEQLLNHSNL